MRTKTDDEIQTFLDGGGSVADAGDWEPLDLRDLRAYALIDEVLAEVPEFELPCDFARRTAARAMPAVVSYAEGWGLAALLGAFGVTGAALTAGVLPRVPMGVGKILAAIAEFGRADVVLAVFLMLPVIVLLDRALPRLLRRPGTTPLHR
jgi:hypothetical protein